jgi:hypothetical protein
MRYPGLIRLRGYSPGVVTTLPVFLGQATLLKRCPEIQASLSLMVNGTEQVVDKNKFADRFKRFSLVVQKVYCT